MGDVRTIVNQNKIGVVVENFSDAEYKVKIQEYLKIKQDETLAQRCFHIAKERFSLNMGIERYREVYNHIM